VDTSDDGSIAIDAAASASSPENPSSAAGSNADGDDNADGDNAGGGEVAPERRAEPTILTPSGLPWRRRDKGPAEGTVSSAAPSPSAPSSSSAPPSLSEPPSLSAASSSSAPSSSAGPLAHTPAISPTSVPTNSPIGRAGRGPEEVRSIMSSYRSGTLRGRIDAARLNDTNHAPEWTDVTQESHGTDEKG
jgi:hypothetical protein